MNDEVLIKVENVSKKFCRTLKRSLWYGVQDVAGEMFCQQGKNDQLRSGEFWAVRDISFELKRGECLGLIGSNGAGKSTLLKMLNGLIKPDKGRISIHGRVGALIELGAGFNPILSGRENIYINASVLGFTKEETDRKFDKIIHFAELEEFIDSPVQNYSSGMKVRLGFAVAAQMEPDVLLIDEVLAVGDIGFQIKCLNRIHEFLRNTAVIFVSHAMPGVARICTHTMVMQKGKNLFFSPDVPKGINTYHQEFKAGEHNIIMSGDVDIEQISINGASADSMPVIPFGGSIHLHIDVNVYTKCNRLGAKIFMWNQDQRPVVSIVTEKYHFFTWENRSNSLSLIVNIPALHLASGKYSINLELYDSEKMVILYRIENAVKFIMGQNISVGSDSLHAAHWSVTMPISSI